MLGVVGAFFRWAHPRSRGENWPHRRGGATTGGLIPAHAGKTVLGVVGAFFRWAHPRSRGENEALRASSDALMGSSPLTRGKHRRVGDPHQPLGLIPAHAGKTPGRPRRPTLGAAHPRSRGENFGPSFEGCSRTGSSPLTRGKRSGQWPGLSAPRLIPAHAGKTWRRQACWRPVPAHPRSRGENLRAQDRPAYHRGSSPLTRGKPTEVSRQLSPARLIPAHAGKTQVPGRESRP